MITTTEAMKEVEQPKFAVRAGLSNSFRAFLRNISDEPPVKELLVSARSKIVAQQILQRVLSLSKLRVDFRYSHPFDIALATYLWVLSRTFPEIARAGAEATAYLPRIWWTDQVTRYILGEWSQKPASATATENLTSTNTSNVSASISLIFPESLLGFEPAKEQIQVDSTATESSEFQQTGAGDNKAPAYTTNSSPKGRQTL